MPAIRVSALVRAALGLLLAVICGMSLPPSPSPSPSSTGPEAAAPQQARVQQAGAVETYETVHAADGEADARRGAALQRDRRRAATAPAGPPGPPAVTVRRVPRTDLQEGRRASAYTRPRPVAAPEPSALQVFLC